jgi:hypothetical protein
MSKVLNVTVQIRAEVINYKEDGTKIIEDVVKEHDTSIVHDFTSNSGKRVALALDETFAGTKDCWYEAAIYDSKILEEE